jgi:hypothetical protein
MASSMSEGELRKMARSKRRRLPTRSNTKAQTRSKSRRAKSR